MVRKGFVERQIEQFFEALAVILGLRESGDSNAALLSLRATNKRLTGLDLDMLASLPPKSLLGFFLTNEHFEAGNALIAGGFMDEAAQIYAAQNDAGRAKQFGIRALTLLLEAQIHEPKARIPDINTRIDDLTAQLGDAAHAPFLEWQKGRLIAALADAKPVTTPP